MEASEALTHLAVKLGLHPPAETSTDKLIWLLFKHVQWLEERAQAYAIDKCVEVCEEYHREQRDLIGEVRNLTPYDYRSHGAAACIERLKRLQEK